MPRDRFDAQGFFTALDVERKRRDLTWKKVAKQAEVSASSLTRMAQGKRPDVDTMAALAAWCGLKVDAFVDRAPSAPVGDQLGLISAYLRADPQLSPRVADAIEALLVAVSSTKQD